MSNSTFAALALFVVVPSAALATDPDASLVYVSGNGMVRVAPDQVVIDLTVTTTDDDLIRVRENSDKDALAILTIGKKHGVADNGFDVSRLELSLDFNEKLRRQIYQVERDITLSLGDLSKLDAILSDLLRERNLKVVGINFNTSKTRQYELDARRSAVADAREKATHLAALNGLKLGKAHEIRVIKESQRPFVTSVTPVVGSAEPRGLQNTERNSISVARDSRKSRVRFVVYQQTKDNSKAGGKPFGLGMIEITSNVNIVFKIVE